MNHDDSNYRTALRQCYDFSVSNIIDYCEEEQPKYPHPYANRALYKSLCSGKAILTTYEQLDCYTSTYGYIHQKRLNEVIGQFLFNIPTDTDFSSYEIVDWGCGQGWGTLCLMEKLANKALISGLKKVTLIESPAPAYSSFAHSVALNRAAWNVRQMISTIKLTHYLKIVSAEIDLARPTAPFQEIQALNYTKPVIFHIFSNVLDMESIDLVGLANFLHRDSQGHKHYILCLSPYDTRTGCNHEDMMRKINRLETFCNLFPHKEYLVNIDILHERKYHFSCRAFAFEYHGEPCLFDLWYYIEVLKRDKNGIS